MRFIVTLHHDLLTIYGATTLCRFPPILLLALLLAVVVVLHAAGLPDTGLDTCYNDTAADGTPASNPASIAADAGTHPRQDCRYGPDAAAVIGLLPKIGAGTKGFDYTKIANNGTALPESASLGTGNDDWACTRDNNTDLTWEIKTGSNADLRYWLHRYTWYDTDGTANGGNAGGTGSDTCNATLPNGLCNTAAYVAAVNAAALCSHTDWRLPTIRELVTLVHAGAIPGIDSAYFPNTPVGYPTMSWSGSTFVADPVYAWSVDFWDGGTYGYDKLDGNYVRVVRGAPF